MKSRIHLVCLCLLLLTVHPLPGSAQQETTAYNLWLVRSQAITSDLIKDVTDLTPFDRALLLAKLAQRWWRDDPEKARSWVLKAIELVETVPNRENPQERGQRLDTGRLLLKIIAPLDQKLSARLVALLSQGAEQEAQAERSANADGLVEAAISLVDIDPKRAADLGALALRVGHPGNMMSLLWRLRTRDARLADALLTQTLAVAQQSLDADLLNSLSYAAFPESRTIGVTPPMPPAELQTEVLKLHLAYLAANQINAENRNSVCLGVISFIAPLITQFDRLLPQQAVIARQSVNQCQGMSPLAQQRLDDAARDQPLNSVADLLRAADDAKDLKVRTVYEFRAASLARQQNDFDRALSILDSMSEDSRAFMGESWESYRWDWAAASALRHLKSGDVQAMRLVINAVPTDLQLYAKLAFVDRLPANRDKDTDPTLEFLNDVRAGLRRLSLSNDKKYFGYLGLLPLAVKYQPAEATAVLKEAVAALNRAEQAKDKDTGDQYSRLSGSEFSKIFPAILLEMNEFEVKEAVASIASAQVRVQVRLELLRVCLERLNSSKQKTPKQRRSASKKE